MAESSDPLLKRLADGDLEAVGRHPLQLWLLPIHLRSHDRYYRDAIESVKREIEDGWELYGHLYASREEFENSEFIRNKWRFNSPYWWGLADVIGFIDIRVSVAAKALEATLFLTTKRPTRRLADKRFVAKKQEKVAIDNYATNESLRAALAAAVSSLAAEAALKRRHLDLEGWQRLLEHTDIVGIVRAEVRDVLANLRPPGAV